MFSIKANHLYGRTAIGDRVRLVEKYVFDSKTLLNNSPRTRMFIVVLIYRILPGHNGNRTAKVKRTRICWVERFTFASSEWRTKFFAPFLIFPSFPLFPEEEIREEKRWESFLTSCMAEPSEIFPKIEWVHFPKKN